MPVGTLIDLGAQRWMWSDSYLETHRSLEMGIPRKPHFEKTSSSPPHPGPRLSSQFYPKLSIVLFSFDTVLSILMLPWASPLWACSHLYKSPDCTWASVPAFFSGSWVLTGSCAWETWTKYYQAYHFDFLPCWKSSICQKEGLWSHHCRVSLSSWISCAYSVLYQCEGEFAPISAYRLICAAVVWVQPQTQQGRFLWLFEIHSFRNLSWYLEGSRLIFQDKTNRIGSHESNFPRAYAQVT